MFSDLNATLSRTEILAYLERVANAVDGEAWKEYFTVTGARLTGKILTLDAGLGEQTSDHSILETIPQSRRIGDEFTTHRMEDEPEGGRLKKKLLIQSQYLIMIFQA